MVVIPVDAIKTCPGRGSSLVNSLREPHGQGSLRPNFSVSSLFPWTTRRPFLTWVSEGKPLRRLLVTSKGSLVWIDALHDGSPISPGCGRRDSNHQDGSSRRRLSTAELVNPSTRPSPHRITTDHPHRRRCGSLHSPPPSALLRTQRRPPRH